MSLQQLLNLAEIIWVAWVLIERQAWKSCGIEDEIAEAQAAAQQTATQSIECVPKTKQGRQRRDWRDRAVDVFVHPSQQFQPTGCTDGQ